MNNNQHVRFSKSNEIIEYPLDSIPATETSIEPRKQSWCKGALQIYYEYCSNTSIHGIQYLGEQRPLKEKVFWVCIFVISILSCSLLIERVYTKWTDTPVIVSFSEKTTPVWQIPFPAITICAETKRVQPPGGMSYGTFYRSLKEHIAANTTAAFTAALNISAGDLPEFRTLLQICETQILDEALPSLSAEPVNHWDVLERMLPPFERYFLICKWFRYIGDCEALFVPTYTEEGICYTFNGLNATDLYRQHTLQYQKAPQMARHPAAALNRNLSWSLQHGYRLESPVRTYPARVLAAGARAGLFIALQSFKQEVDYACRGPVQGFKVLLHSPDDVPVVSKQFIRIAMGKEVQVTVKPNMITTSAGIAEYEPIRRQCYLNDERHLAFYKVYTQTNCETECAANFTLEQCDCVKFSMPRLPDTPVCGEERIHCYEKAENNLLLREFHEGLRDSTFNHRGVTSCNCLPACTSLVYNTEISQGNFDLQEMLNADGDTTFLEEFPGSMMSRLSIFFKENQFITSKRSELYGVTDFLANCGGIFGLFMGFSILSMVEILYHFSLRLWSNMRGRNY